MVERLRLPSSASTISASNILVVVAAFSLMRGFGWKVLFKVRVRVRVRLRWVKVVCVFRCNLPHTFFSQIDLSLLRATAVTWDVGWGGVGVCGTTSTKSEDRN